jgi:hypothetical protein
MAGIARRTVVKSLMRPAFCGCGEAIVNMSYVTELTTDDLIEAANDFDHQAFERAAKSMQ